MTNIITELTYTRKSIEHEFFPPGVIYKYQVETFDKFRHYVRQYSEDRLSYTAWTERTPEDAAFVAEAWKRHKADFDILNEYYARVGINKTGKQYEGELTNLRQYIKNRKADLIEFF